MNRLNLERAGFYVWVCGVTVCKLQVFADYNQVYLHDESVEADFADSWDEKAYKNMAALIDGAICVATARNTDVLVEILICKSDTKRMLKV